MNIEMRDPQFAHYVEDIAQAIRLPDASFAVAALEVAKEVLLAWYDAYATPDPSIVRNALKGIAV